MKKALLLYTFLAPFIMKSQILFEDSTNSLGANYAYGNSFLGGGVSFADFNGDGWDDLTYATDETQRVHFLQNNSGVFNKITLSGIDHDGKAKQVIWVDYDNDGDKDFFVTSIIGQNKLYRNDGAMSFTDVTNSSGIFLSDLPTYGAAFGDIDNDGDLDLMLSNRGDTLETRNYLYRNDSGTFVDITISAGILMEGELSFCAAFFDYDNDGDQDIYIANDKYSYMNRLYKNNGDETFDDVSISSGAGIILDAMSTTIGDYNADGWFDIYVTNTRLGNELLQNNGDGTFTNQASTTGTEFLSTGWGAVFFDADNDSNLDLYVSGSFDGSDPDLLPSAFYHNNGSNVFSIPTGVGFETDTRISYSNAIGDINNDGKPDLVIMNNSVNNFLWENKTVNSNNWVKIKLEGVSGNKDGIGNRIEIRANGISQYRYTVCGEGYLGQNSGSEFVGVSNATNIDYIKVTWNTTGIEETITNISPNQAITIKEGSGVVLSTANTALNNFSIYPNPSQSGIFSIHNTQAEPISISVYDLKGKNIATFNSVENQINLSPFASGVYILKIKSGTKISVQKVIKE